MKSSSHGIKETSYLNKVWGSIEEMPIYNWIKILEMGDLKWLFINKGRVTQKTADHWLNLQDEYINEFGLDEGYKQQLRLMRKLNDLNIQFVLTRDRSLLNLINMTEADLTGSKVTKATSFYQVLDHVEKYKGFAIDPKTTSVMKWYYSLKNMSNGNTD